jgi:uncharacterized protein (TIGR03067 family)
MRRALTTCVLLLVPAPLSCAADVSKGDKDLEGDWKKVATVVAGVEERTTPGAGIEMTVRGESLTIRAPGVLQECKLNVDATKTPKAMDATGSGRDDGGRTTLAIYEVVGDELRVCSAEPGKDRPTEFSSTAANGWVLATFKRVKK